MPGHERGKFRQNGLLTPLRQKCWAAQKKATRSAGSALDFATAICASVVAMVHGSWRNGLPKCLYIAMVMGDVLPLTQASMAASGVSTIMQVPFSVWEHNTELCCFLDWLKDDIETFMN